VFRGFLNVAGKILLTFSTLGIEKYKNNIYLDVAKGFYEQPSLQILALVFGIIFGVLFGMLSIILKKRKDEVVPQSKINEWLVSNTNKVKIILIFYILFVLSFSFLSLARVTYINKSIAYYDQLIKIASPYLALDEEKVLNSDFAQIKNKNDYLELTNNLEQIIKKQNKKLPEPPSFIF
ncbi:MAG: hypothetical protein NT094_04215, partial [Candidatus Staskawiczbacteria bacterium]|nr:hypothetical protein [Candidatus Staskawiczbacteria bacterium]